MLSPFFCLFFAALLIFRQKSGAKPALFFSLILVITGILEYFFLKIKSDPFILLLFLILFFVILLFKKNTPFLYPAMFFSSFAYSSALSSSNIGILVFFLIISSLPFAFLLKNTSACKRFLVSDSIASIMLIVSSVLFAVYSVKADFTPGKTIFFQTDFFITQYKGTALPAIFLLCGLFIKAPILPFNLWLRETGEEWPKSALIYYLCTSLTALSGVLLKLSSSPILGKEYLFMIFVIYTGLACTVISLILFRLDTIRKFFIWSAYMNSGFIFFAVFPLRCTPWLLIIIIALYNISLLSLAFLEELLPGHKTKQLLRLFYGLSARNSVLALLLIISFFSLLSAPPLGTFIVKMKILYGMTGTNICVSSMVLVMSAAIIYSWLFLPKLIKACFGKKHFKDKIKLNALQYSLSVLLVLIMLAGYLLPLLFCGKIIR